MTSEPLPEDNGPQDGVRNADAFLSDKMGTSDRGSLRLHPGGTALPWKRQRPVFPWKFVARLPKEQVI